jgi:hypothetical protein
MARSEVVSTLRWLAFALAVFGGTLAWKRFRVPEASPSGLASWQRPVSDLSPEGRAAWARIRAGLLEVERARATSGTWPEPGDAFFPEWRRAQHRLVINYLGEAADQRWLALVLEPEPDRPGTPREPPAPDDEEHHTLPDGTALHVTVWSQPRHLPPPEGVVAFPASEGWTEWVDPAARRAKPRRADGPR